MIDAIETLLYTAVDIVQLGISGVATALNQVAGSVVGSI
jgi:hypothetical protein